jgi:hypothetical protein
VPQNGHLHLLNDPAGLKRSLVPVLVRQCSAEKLLKPIIYIDLMVLNEEPAEKRLMEESKANEPSPAASRIFQESQTSRPNANVRNSRVTPRPKVQGHRCTFQSSSVPPSDLEKRRFIERAFLSIVEYFHSTLKELTRQNEGLETDFPRPWRCASLPWA